MICSSDECKKNFDAKTHNQKYCSEECCRIATNKRIMEKYYEKKVILGGITNNCPSTKTGFSNTKEPDTLFIDRKGGPP